MFGEIEDDRQRLFVGDLIGEVDRGALKIGGNSALADALGDRGAAGFRFAGGVIKIKSRAGGIGESDFDVRILRLERNPDAGQRAASADGADETIDSAFGLVPDFTAGRLDMA